MELRLTGNSIKFVCKVTEKRTPIPPETGREKPLSDRSPFGGENKKDEKKKKIVKRVSVSPLLRLFLVETQGDERGLVAPALATLAAQPRHPVPGRLQRDRAQPSGLHAALHAKRDLVIGTGHLLCGLSLSLAGWLAGWLAQQSRR